MFNAAMLFENFVVPVMLAIVLPNLVVLLFVLVTERKREEEMLALGDSLYDEAIDEDFDRWCDEQAALERMLDEERWAREDAEDWAAEAVEDLDENYAGPRALTVEEAHKVALAEVLAAECGYSPEQEAAWREEVNAPQYFPI